MIRTYILPIVSLLAIAIFTQCRKTNIPVTSPVSPNIYIYPDSALLANFGYQVGTYWIYRDSATGEKDSLYVVSTSQDEWANYNHSGSGQYNKVNYISMHKIPIDSVEQNYESDWQLALIENRGVMVIGDTNYTALGTYSFNFPLSTTPITDSSGVVSNYTIFPLLGNTYDNVTEMKQPTSSAEIHYFLCNMAGLIKIRIKENGTYRVWELLRSHIIR